MIGAARGTISLMKLRMLEQIPNCSVGFYSITSRPKRYEEEEVHEHACMSKGKASFNQLQKAHWRRTILTLGAARDLRHRLILGWGEGTSLVPSIIALRLS